MEVSRCFFLFVLLGIVVNSLGEKSVESAPFGRKMLPYFMMAKGFTNMNHGSFGSPPRVVIEAQRRYQDECEAMPDNWFRGGYESYLVTVRQELASYLSTNASDLVLVENASSGMSAVFRSFNFQPGDVLLELSTAYPMVNNTFSWLTGFEGVVVEQVPVLFPGNGATPVGMNGESLVDAVTAAINAWGGRVKLASFSQVESSPPVIYPVADLATACKALGVSVLVDGAHALGHIPVNLTQLQMAGVDYWVGNGHKWLYSPKGSAVLWVTPLRTTEENTLTQEVVVPTVISSAFLTGVIPWGSDFQNRFQYTGTRDYTPFCAMSEAIAFRTAVGGDDAIIPYIHNLAVWAQHYLANLWQTEVLLPDSMTGMMAYVRIPNGPLAALSNLRLNLMLNYNIETVVLNMIGLTPPGSGYVVNSFQTQNLGTLTWWFRLSAQIYLEEADFVRLGSAVMTLLNITTTTGSAFASDALVL